MYYELERSTAKYHSELANLRREVERLEAELIEKENDLSSGDRSYNWTATESIARKVKELSEISL